MKLTKYLKIGFEYSSKILAITVIILLAFDLIFVGVESCFKLEKKITPIENHPEFWSEAKTRKIINAYKGFKEKSEDVYIPYSIWGYREFHSDLFNIDKYRDLSLRRTRYNARNPQYVIWFLGGSTAFGDYTESDRATIPSSLSKYLNKKGLRVKIYNFGIAGYYSTQETYLLAQLLKVSEFPKPNLVIFYDGFNEFQNLQDAYIYKYPADFPSSYLYIKDLFERPLSAWIGRTLIYKDTMAIISWFKSTLLGSDNQMFKLDRRRLSSLMKKQVEAYQTNMVMADALAKHYDFKVLSFIQPTLFQKEKKSTYEKWFYEASPAKFMSPFFLECYSLLKSRFKRSEGVRPIFMDSCFDDVRQSVFIDTVHLSTFGNGKVAQRMLPYVIKKLKEGRGTRDEGVMRSSCDYNLEIVNYVILFS